MNNRLAGLLAAAVALAVLGFAYYVQYGLHRLPCELCLWERWPYRLVAVLGILGALGRGPTTKWLLALAGLVMVGDMGIAFLHVGVEQGWWPSPLPECNGILTPGAPLPLTPAVPCDRPAYLVTGLPVSMAMMDLIFATLFAATLLVYGLRRERRYFR
jgi:disulfide bond formation protein DsbB